MQRDLHGKNTKRVAVIERERIDWLPLRIHARVEQPDGHTCVELLPVAQIRHRIEVRRIECRNASANIHQGSDALVERTNFQKILFCQSNRRAEVDGLLTSY